MPDSLQDTYAPNNACFGCGPANRQGAAQIKSFVAGRRGGLQPGSPRPCYEAFPGVLNGGIVGALLDCHLNWTAAHGT